MDDLSDLLSVSANEFWEAVGSFLPSLFGAILLVLLGALVAKLAEKLVRKVFEIVNVDKLQKNKAVKKTLDDNELNIDVTNLAGRITFWVVIIIFALAATEVLGLNAMSDTIRDLLAYLPSVLAAAVVLTVTIAGARLLRDAILAGLRRMSVDYANPIANISYYVLLVFGVLMALSQLGFDTTIIANNVTIIVAGIVLALALAFGLGGREVAGRIVEQMYENTADTKKHKK